MDKLGSVLRGSIAFVMVLGLARVTIQSQTTSTEILGLVTDSSGAVVPAAKVTITRLAERVRELSGSQSPIKYVPYEEAYESGFEDMPRRLPDLTKVTALIGYKTRYALDDILTHVIEHFRRK